MRIITGIKSTGEMLHLGNLLGAMLPFREVAKGNDAACFIADLHSLTSVKDGDTLRRQTFELAVEFLAIYGVESGITIFRQSDIRNISLLQWILCNYTPLSLMLRAHSFKDSEAKGSDMNMGVFNYPILMAADIIGYGVDIVPVGQDQRQHLEMTRDIARAFNKVYQEPVFIEPAEYIMPSVAVVPGIDGRKMSKSYNNFIGIFEEEKSLKKKISQIVTDSKGVDEPKDPETCNVFALIAYFGSPDRVDAIRSKYKAGGYGYGHAKAELFEILTEYLSPYQKERSRLLADPAFVETRLAEGAAKMNARLNEKLQRVRELTGV